MTVISEDVEVLEGPMDSFTMARKYTLEPANMTEEERNNPLLAETLEKLSEDHDIIVEVIEE